MLAVLRTVIGSAIMSKVLVLKPDKEFIVLRRARRLHVCHEPATVNARKAPPNSNWASLAKV